MFLIRRRSCYCRSFVGEVGAGVAFGYAVRLFLGAAAAPVLAVCACESFVFWGGDVFLWLSLAHQLSPPRLWKTLISLQGSSRAVAGIGLGRPFCLNVVSNR